MKINKTIYLSAVFILLALAVILCVWSQRSRQEDVEKPPRSASRTSSAKRGESSGSGTSSRHAPVAKHKIFDERTGLTVYYDRIEPMEKLIEIFQEFDPRRAERFRKANIKIYLRGDSIVMLRKSDGYYKSISRADYAKRWMNEEGWLRVISETSDYLDIKDKTKMKNLFEYMDSTGWDSSRGRPVYERTIIMVEVAPTVKFIKRMPKGTPVELGTSYPALFQVRSKGNPSHLDASNDRNYPIELSIERRFSIQAIVNYPPERGANPFFAQIGTGVPLEEGTPKAIELYGVRY